MNVCLVIPHHSNLPLLVSEAETLVNLLNPELILQGEVSEDRLVAAINSHVEANGRFDGFWVATHMSDREVALSDGTISSTALTQYISMAGASWVVLNGCESEGLAGSIAAMGCDVVSVAMTPDMRGVLDRDALRTATMLATKLRDNGGDLRGAFDSIPNVASQYRFYPAGETERRAYSNDRNLDVSIARLEAKLDNLGERVTELTQALRDRPTAAQTVGMVFFASMIVLGIVALFFYLFQRGVL